MVGFSFLFTMEILIHIQLNDIEIVHAQKAEKMLEATSKSIYLDTRIHIHTKISGDISDLFVFASII